MRNIYLGFLFRFDGVFVVNRTWKMCFATLHKSNCISWCKFAFYFAQKKLLFQFYALIFTKHPHQFIYSTHLFNKIFVFFYNFFLLSLIAPLSHRPTLSHRPRPNMQKKVALKIGVVFVGVQFRRFRWSKWLASSIGLLMLILALKIQVLQASFVVNFLYFLFAWWESGGKD